MTSGRVRVQVDSRVGSKALLGPLGGILGGGFEVVGATMRFGDVAWSGNGPEMEPVPCAVELKTVPDLLGSMKGRLIEHQLPGLLGHYKVAYLMVEGAWSVHADGMLWYQGGAAGRMGWLPAKWRPSGYKYLSVVERLESIGNLLGVKVVHTTNRAETLWRLRALIQWWQKPWEGHQSVQPWCGIDVLGNPLAMRVPGLAEQFAALLPGIGRERAFAVAEHFKHSTETVATASVEQWMGIRAAGKTKTGKARPGIGREMAEAIRAMIRGGGK